MTAAGVLNAIHLRTGIVGNWLLKRVFGDMRITRVRVISQAFWFCLFLFFVLVADLRYLGGYPVSLLPRDRPAGRRSPPPSPPTPSTRA